jgi:D-glycero-beta-D-manno-heptose 1-phosphate adenylyltransferase
MNTTFPHAACVQLAVRVGTPQANLQRVQQMVEAHNFPPETLVVLPELWATGFAYSQVNILAQETPALLAALQDIAHKYTLYFAGSLLEPQAQGKPYNTLFVVGPEGILGSSRKQQLFHFWEENRYLQAGGQPQPIFTPFGPLGGLICYELRFPEISRSHAFAGCRLLVLSAQWPLARLDHWQLLVRARAVENQCLVVACNASGFMDAQPLAGHSLVVDANGQVLAEAGEGEEVLQAALSLDTLSELRSRFCPCGERPYSPPEKICDLAQVQERLRRIRQQGSRIVLTNGCFDLLHAGHVSYLEQARACGDCLVVGLNADASVQRLKGPSRPITPEQERAKVLAALACVDFVVIFSEDTPFHLITALTPQVLVKGADWPEEQIVGAAEVKAAGGEVRRIPFTWQRSTTGLIERIRTG